MASKIVQYLGTGRRKTAVARVFLRVGKGDVTVNGRALDNYFPTEASRGAVKQALLARGPRAVKTAALLIKRGRQVVEERPDFVAFEIPDEFVVGYGLDYRDRFRNLPFVAALEPDDLAAR